MYDLNHFRHNINHCWKKKHMQKVMDVVVNFAKSVLLSLRLYDWHAHICPNKIILVTPWLECNWEKRS